MAAALAEMAGDKMPFALARCVGMTALVGGEV